MATVEQVKNLLKEELARLYSKLENMMTIFNEIQKKKTSNLDRKKYDDLLSQIQATKAKSLQTLQKRTDVKNVFVTIRRYTFFLAL